MVPDWIAIGMINLVLMVLIVLRLLKRRLRRYALVRLFMMNHNSSREEMSILDGFGDILTNRNENKHPC